jgi:hypothetical protein
MRTAKITSVLVLVAAAAGISTNASAIVLTQGDAHYIGYVFDGIPANSTNEALMINSLLDKAPGSGTTVCSQIPSENCSRVGSTLDVSSFADATATGAVRNETGSGTFDNTAGYLYIIGKYDGPNFGDLVWYIGDLTGINSIQLTAGGYDLSHYTLFNPGTRVPEPATLTLLSLGLLGVGFTAARRRRLSA